MSHEFRAFDITALGGSVPIQSDGCAECGLPEAAHRPLADHPEERRLRSQEVEASATLLNVARRAARSLREHRRVDAVVLLSQLELVVDNLRLAMRQAIDDQMEASRGREGQ